MSDKIQKVEDAKVPKGTVDLVGFGRLGLRIGINLIQVHRGGPKVINIFDGQKISNGDIIFHLNGGKVGQYKGELLKELCKHDPDFRAVNTYNEDISDENIDKIQGDVVAIQIAGGDTIPTAAKIIKKAHKNGATVIGTGGIFGIGEEKIIVKDISEFDDSNPVINALRKEGINENYKIISTNRFIRDNVPITPYVLDKVANTITREILKAL
ncbi:MAG: hypothetical protein ACI4VU_00875 [Methanobrevibacter sp.]